MMEKITINTDRREDRIKGEVKAKLNEIQNNAERGNNTTELYVDKDIAGDVRSQIEKELEESGTNYDFQIVRRSPNEYTGRMQSFTSETIGDQKRYKIKIF